MACTDSFRQYRQRYTIYNIRGIPKFQVQKRAVRTRHVHTGSVEIRGNGHGVRKLRVGSDGVDEEQICAEQHARLVGRFGTMNFFERRNANQIGERLPIARGSVWIDGSKPESAEGGR